MATKTKRNRAATAHDPLHSFVPPARTESRDLVPIAPAAPARDAHGFDPDAYDWVPVPRKHRVDGWTPERQRAFIGRLSDTGSVRTAATESGLSASSAYRLRRSPEGRAFAAAWDAAIQQAAPALVDAAFERAVHGSEEPVYDRNGRVIVRRMRQSDAMMMFLLRKHFPGRYGDLHRDRSASDTAGPASPPPVDEALALLGPVPPADPAATLDPDVLELALARADNGRFPGAPTNEDDGAMQSDPAFEAALERAKAEANDYTGVLSDPGIDDEDWYDDDDDDDENN